MNKQEFLNLLNSRYHTVAEPILQLEIASVKMYIIGCTKLVGTDSIQRLNIGFSVENEGLAGEIAYWTDRDPEMQVPRNQFIIDLETYIASKIQAGIIAAAFLVDVDLINEKATASGVAQIATEWKEIKVLLRRKTDGTIEHIVLQLTL